MWRPERRMFSLACILILLTAAAHTAGNLLPHRGGEEQNKVENVMEQAKQPMGLGMEPSYYDIFRAITFTMSITFFALGGVGLMLTASDSVPSEVIRNIAWFYLIWNGAFTVLGYYYRVPPPLICGAVIELALVVALLPAGKSADAALTAKS